MATRCYLIDVSNMQEVSVGIAERLVTGSQVCNLMSQSLGAGQRALRLPLRLHVQDFG
jgi:hypothetical protein